MSIIYLIILIIKYDEIVSSYPHKNIIYRIYDNKIYFNNNALPIEYHNIEKIKTITMH